MQDLNDLQYFAAVVEHGGFAAAGRALGVQKSRLSRRVLALEERLGVRLLNRSSRRFSVTEVGREVHERCRAMLIEAEAAEQAALQMHAEPRGVVRMSCPSGLLTFGYGEMLARFMARHPQVEVHLESTGRRVDVIAEGVDVAIRVRFPPLAPTELVMRRLEESTQCLVASPRLVANAPLASPADLEGLPSLDLAPPQGRHTWQLHHADGRIASVAHQPRLVTGDMSVLRAAAVAGVGVVQLPTLYTHGDVQAGRLVHVLPAWRPRAGIVHAVFPSRRGLLPAVRALVDFLAAECAARAGSVADGRAQRD